MAHRAKLWEFQGNSACFPNTTLHGLGDFPQVPVTMIQLTPGITNTDDGFFLKNVGIESLGPKYARRAKA